MSAVGCWRMYQLLDMGIDHMVVILERCILVLMSTDDFHQL